MDHPPGLDRIQDALIELRLQLLAVDDLAARLERQEAGDVDGAHQDLRSEVERLGHLTEGLFGLSCAHDGVTAEALRPAG